ncbi:helicase Snf2 family [Alkalihalophilus pseudofirmus OF4]|uniref:Helicase Snf2 family n=1 Tax=Alkalihalophilus pseudofirmus (strain ATCC BAA-2126 / JCM 17055 / OF4) TaxID=398511 RepID=D3FW22_ALKPO|nr:MULTISPECIES: SNF2 helicase associated domain-containing protein [Alkalihalophilus]ADC50454.1 helicase Snf2 family [Alkalihalophilus pseudofirmus OF4]MED1603200.1 SNF2 helicase associated domain-containing protein [Alkalihalophilus marmarensis]
MTTVLSDFLIRQLASSQPVYKRGLEYYRAGLVEYISYSELYNSYQAKVSGSYMYEVEIDIEDDGSLDFACDCEASYTYPGACKHVVATLLELQERGTVFERKRQILSKKSSLLTEFKSVQKWKQPSLKKKQKLQVEFELKVMAAGGYFKHMVNYIQLGMKVGENRLYVVKDLYAFLKAVNEKRPYAFTNKFNYEPDQYVFDEEDEAVFELLFRLLAVEEHHTRNTYGHKSTKRHLLMPAVYMHSFLDLLAGRYTTLHVDSTKEYKESLQVKTLEKGDSFFTFLLEETDDIVELQANLHPDVLFVDQPYQSILKKDTFYKLTEEQAKSLEILANEYEEDEPIDVIPNDQLESFCSEVLPVISQYGTVQMEDTLKDKIDQKPLQASIKVDYEDDELVLEVSFRYGQEVRNPFAKKDVADSNTIMVRDVEKEQTILQVLEQYPFEVEGEKLVLHRIQTIIEFLFEYLPSLKSYADIYLTSDAKKLLFQPASSPSVSIDVEGESNWLDVSFSIDGISDEEIVDVLRALYNKKKYHRLSNGSFIHLEEEQYGSLQKAVDSLGASAKELNKSMNVPLHKAFSLDESQAGLKLSKKLHRLIQDVQSPEFSEWMTPERLDADLRSYQETGYRWIRTLAKSGLGGILADDMGLGKTLQTITHLQADKEAASQAKSLIIAPASVIYNWEKEIKRFAPELHVVVIAGAKAEREHARTIKEADVWITSYPLIQRDYEKYEGITFDTMVLDEAQAIKNEQAKTTKAVRAIKASSRFALSGTPIENRIDELYTLMQTILPGLLGTKKQFRERSHEEIAKRIRPFILRRLKREVLKELPEKMESVQYTDLLPEQKKYYLAQVKQLRSDVDDAISSDQFQKKRIEILAGLTKLRQICCHPRLVSEEDEVESGKLLRLMEYVEEGMEAGQRMVIFSQFTSMLAIIRAEFEERGWEFFYLDGQTPAVERLRLADQFNQGEKSLFLVSLKAGGTGLNLTGGDTVILYDTWWNPAIEEQAADRVYRFGQTKNVQVIKLIANGTIEEKILALHEKKKALVDAVIQPGEAQMSSLSAEEIKELLTF